MHFLHSSNTAWSTITVEIFAPASCSCIHPYMVSTRHTSPPEVWCNQSSVQSQTSSSCDADGRFDSWKQLHKTNVCPEQHKYSSHVQQQNQCMSRTAQVFITCSTTKPMYVTNSTSIHNMFNNKTNVCHEQHKYSSHVQQQNQCMSRTAQVFITCSTTKPMYVTNSTSIHNMFNNKTNVCHEQHKYA